MADLTKLSLHQRREAFRQLVEAQDRGLSVPTSRAEVAERRGLTDAQVRSIEEEGLAKEWPPLDDEPARAPTSQAAFLNLFTA